MLSNVGRSQATPPNDVALDGPASQHSRELWLASPMPRIIYGIP